MAQEELVLSRIEDNPGAVASGEQDVLLIQAVGEVLVEGVALAVGRAIAVVAALK
jgi:hypothetical protein